jgi:hypothetical protein
MGIWRPFKNALEICAKWICSYIQASSIFGPVHQWVTVITVMDPACTKNN